MDLTVKIEGLESLQKAFSLLPQRVAVKAASKAVRAGANVILKAARMKVPVDTGNLKKSIAVKVLNKRRDAMQVAAIIGPRVVNRRSKAKHDGFYGFFVEYGTKKVRSQPFMRPAYDENKVAAQQAIMDIVGEAIEREAQALYGVK
jgi:HK97 gp10 family phage protein